MNEKLVSSAEGRTFPAFATIEGFGEIASLNRSSIYRELKTGNLVAVKVGRRILIDVSKSLAWMSEQAYKP